MTSKLILVSGLSGAGKTALIRAALRDVSDYIFQPVGDLGLDQVAFIELLRRIVR